MTRYLVTGAQGFVGRSLCAALLHAEPGALIVGTGRSAEGRTSFTHTVSWQGRRVAAPLPAALRLPATDRYRYVPCSLNDVAALRRLVEESAPDVVIHLAAGLRDDPPAALVDTNVSGTIALLSVLASTAYRPRLILGSSGSVYGIPAALPLAETHGCAPVEPYAMTKLAAELAATALARGASIPLVIARIFNIAGAGQDERHVVGRFAAQAAAIVTGSAPPVIEIGDMRPTRDFIDVRDVAAALCTLVRNGTPGETYNVASGRETAIGEILASTLRAASLTGKVALQQHYSRAADIDRAYADVANMTRCGYAPAFSLEATIADAVAYYLTDVAGAAGAATTSATS